MQDWLSAGGTFPDLALPDHNGVPRTLSELAAGDPTFVHFYRGFWCPKEQTFFRTLVDLQDKAEVAYSRIVSVSIDPPEVSAAFRAGLGARWTFLSDHERSYVDGLGLREGTDTGHRPYAPWSAVVQPDLAITTVWNGYWFWGRPTGDELHVALREATRVLRSDWTVDP
jgi:peroxiredoxin